MGERWRNASVICRTYAVDPEHAPDKDTDGKH